MLIRVVVVAVIAWLLWRLAKSGSVSSPAVRGRGRFQCSTCRHCATEFEDGVLCRFGKRETFKNEVHIANCHSWQRRA